MLVDVYCKKCEQTGTLDIGNMTKEEVDKWLNNDGFGFSCFGYHVEVGRRSHYWSINWGTLRIGNALSEGDFLDQLAKVSNKYFESSEFLMKYDVLQFISDICWAIDKATGKQESFAYAHSPSGKRYYY